MYRSVSCREILRCVSDLYMLNYVSHNKRLLFLGVWFTAVGARRLCYGRAGARIIL
jgi:hypothetical protein